MSEIICISTNGREFKVSNDYFRSLHSLRSECNSYTQSETRYAELLSEHDKKVREDAIDDFVNAYMKDEEQYDGCRECERNDDYCCIQCFRDRYLEQLKVQRGEENET